MAKTFQANAFQGNAFQPDYIFGGFVASEESTFGGALVPETINITGGFVKSEERTFGGALVDVPMDTALLVSFPTPQDQLVAGAGLQEFRLQVRKGGSAGAHPTAALELWHFNGVSRSKLADVLSATSVSTTMVVSGTWDASILPSLSGAGVELKVVGTAVSGAWVEVGALEWNAVGFTQQVVGGFIASEERTFGGRLVGENVSATGGFIKSEERTFGGTLTGPFVQGGFTGGPMTAGRYPAGPYPLPGAQERTFGGTLSVSEDTRTRVTPSSIVSMNGVSGDVGDISDDPDSPDNSFLTKV